MRSSLVENRLPQHSLPCIQLQTKGLEDEAVVAAGITPVDVAGGIPPIIPGKGEGGNIPWRKAGGGAPGKGIPAGTGGLPRPAAKAAECWAKCAAAAIIWAFL